MDSVIQDHERWEVIVRRRFTTMRTTWAPRDYAAAIVLGIREERRRANWLAGLPSVVVLRVVLAVVKRQSVVRLAEAAGNQYPLLPPMPFSRSLEPPAMTWPSPPHATKNPFRRGSYQTWTNRGPVTRRRRFVELRRDVPPRRHVASCAEPEYTTRGDYNLFNNSDHRAATLRASRQFST